MAIVSMSSLVAAAVLAASPLERAADVAASVGMNVHIEYTDGGYRDLSRVAASLDYLGIRTLRDAAPNPSNQGQAGYATLTKAGFKFDLFLSGEPIEPVLRRIEKLEQQAPGSVIGIEGPNEVNNHSGFSYAGERDPHRAGTAYQNALYAKAKADPELAVIPIVAFTDYPYTPGRSDLGNGHVYPPGDAAPGAVLAAAARDLAHLHPGQPGIFTEVGYPTSRDRPGVSDLAQARLLLTSLLDNAFEGIEHTYIYQLLDAYPDPANADQEKHFGVFDLAYSPKTSARMLRRFMAIYSDSSPRARTFTPRPVSLSWSGGGPDVHRFLTQKASGEIVAAVWRETKVYDFASAKDVDVPPVAVDLQIPAGRYAKVIDAVAGTEGEVRPGSRVTRLWLGANPLLVQISPKAEPVR